MTRGGRFSFGIAAEDLRSLSPRRICLIKPSALGDIVQTLPLLPVLRAAFPRAEVTWVINRELRGLVDGHPDLAGVIPFHRRGTARDWLTLFGSLARSRFDLVLDLQGLLRTAVMTAVTGAPIRVGLQTAREGAHLTVNCTVPETTRQVPAHARNWRLAEVLGLGDHPRQTIIATSADDDAWASQQLEGLPRPLLAFHPGARWETKRWPVERFAAVAARAMQSWGAGVVILGSPAERPDADLLQQQIAGLVPRGLVRNLTGSSTLKQLSALLSRVDVAVSNDSGPMHLAAGLGTPTLGIFTCTSAVQSGPPGPTHELVSTTVDCAASYRKTCPHHGVRKHCCHAELDVERVWRGLQRLVERNILAPSRSTRAA